MHTAAVETSGSWTDRIFAPYEWVGQSSMAVLATVGVALGLAASRFGIRFDGFLDLHRTPGGIPVPLSTALADQLVALPLCAMVAWLVLRGFGPSPRWGALVLVLGIMRLPLVLASPAILATPDPARLAPGPLDLAPSLIGVALVAVLCFAWAVTLLVTGVRFATALRGGRLAGAVISIILVAEAVSKLALALPG